MEKVDIVDENLNVLYQVDKEEAHKQGLLHKTVVAEVVNSKGEWLLVKQAPQKQDPGQYVSPIGGHVISGEHEVDALKREAEEEIGYTGNFDYDFIGHAIFDRNVRSLRENHLFITYLITSDINPKLNEESVGFKWFSVEEIKKLLREKPEMFGQSFHFLVKKMFAKEFLTG